MRATPPTAPASNQSLEQEKDWDAELLRFQVEDLFIPTTAGASLSIPLSLGDVPCELQLEAHTLRDDGFRVLVQNARGQWHEQVAPETKTYRGHVEGLGGARVAASIVEGQLSAMIRLEDGSRWYVEPIAAASNQHIVYHSQDVVERAHQCGADDGAKAMHLAAASEVIVASAGGPMRIADIAFDADYEFFLANGSSVDQTVDDIESILNGVSLIYESELNISYELTTIVIRTSSADPYTVNDADGLLAQFRSEWNSNMLEIHRDIAHLMTGRTLTNSVIGNAYVNTMCDSCSGGSGFGLSRSRFSGIKANRICLTAHEIGHNWGAEHCNGQSDCGIMCSMLGGCAGTCTRFGQSSLAVISATASSKPCLTTLAPPLAFPICETFTSSLNNAAWSYNAAASVSTEAINPPSPPYVLQIDNCCTACSDAPDDIRTNFIRLGGVSDALLLYHTQHTGGFLSLGAQLVVEYWSSGGAWIELNRVVSDGNDQSSFDSWAHQLPAGALHDEARFRFRFEGATGVGTWFVDDFAVAAAIPESPILYIRQDMVPSGTGNGWQDALSDVQGALQVAACSGGVVNEIRVAEGIYKPDRGSGDRAATFQLLSNVTLLGGFAGTETNADERRPDLYPTVLSGDAGVPGNAADNVYHVITGSGADSTAVLDGFTISAGRADAVANDGGGGLRVVNGSPTITNCVLENNAGNFGGGIYVGSGSLPGFTECTILDNAAFSSGGGLYVALGGQSYFDRCRFISNSAVTFGGAVHIADGRVDALNTVFTGNTGSNGGAVYNSPPGTINLQNCTLSFNAATGFVGGLLNSTNGDALINSSVLWGNSDMNGMLQSSQNAGAAPEMDYTCIQGHLGTLGGIGNTGDDPLFVDADGADQIPGTLDDDFRLSSSSTLIDSGDPAVSSAIAGAIDLDGSPRVLCGRIDMGAFEFGAGDFDCDRSVDLTDYSNWQTCMTGPAGTLQPACTPFDFDVNQRVDLRDYLRFLQAFQE